MYLLALRDKYNGKTGRGRLIAISFYGKLQAASLKIKASL
jgi:hypothetical protein